MANNRTGTQVPVPEFLSELFCVLSSAVFLVLAGIHRSYIDIPSVYKDRRVLLLIAGVILAVLFSGFLQFVLTVTHFIAHRYSRALLGTIALFVLIVLTVVACTIDSPTLLFAS